MQPWVKPPWSALRLPLSKAELLGFCTPPSLPLEDAGEQELRAELAVIVFPGSLKAPDCPDATVIYGAHV